MTATYRSAASGGSNHITADNAAFSCPLPAGATAGDFIVWWVTGGEHFINSFDANYPQIGTAQRIGTNTSGLTCFGGVYTGTAPVIDIAVDNVDADGVDNFDCNISAVCVQKSGGGTLTLDQVSENQDASSGTSHATASITPGFNDSCVLALYGGGAVGGITGDISTFTERVDAEYFGHCYGATLDQGAAASVSATMTSNNNERACKIILSIYEAAGGGGGGQPPRTMHQQRLRRA